MNLFVRSISTRDFLAMLRNLSVTLRAGVSLLQGLALLEKNSSRRTRPVFGYLRRQLESGTTLADAMAASPWKFPTLAVNLVRAGEVSGNLQQNLEEIVHHMRKTNELKRKVKSAMMYPIFVLIALFGMGLSMGTLVLPKLIPLFDSLGVELPFTTRMILVLARFFDHYGLIVSPIAIAGCFFLYFLARLRIFRPVFHAILLKIPLIGIVAANATIVQIARTLSSLLKSGIPIVEALKATTQATVNIPFQNTLRHAIPFVQGGNSLAQGLRSGGNLFPEITITLIDVGESTGSLSDTLTYMAEYYEDEVDYAVRNLASSIEPILLIFVGIIVGIFVLSIITPIYDVTSSIS